MSKLPSIRVLIAVMVITLTGLLLIQIYLIADAVNQQNDMFNQNVRIALHEVIRRLDEQELARMIQETPADMQDSISLVPDKLSSSSAYKHFIHQLLSDSVSYYPDSLSLKQALKEELQNNRIATRYEAGIYNDRSFAFSYADSDHYHELLSSEYQQIINYNRDGSSNRLTLIFPDKTRFLINNIIFLLISCLVLLTILVLLFISTVRIIYAQRRLTKMRSDIINNITHELKTPISTISLACQAMKDPDIVQSGTLRDRYVRIIDEENMRLGAMVENVLQTSIIDKGDYKLTLEITDLHEVLDAALESLKIQIEEKSFVIDKLYLANNTQMNGDAMHLTNLFLNIFENALKYVKPEKGNPRLTIKTINEERGFLSIHIIDNGMGIQRENQKFVFDRLFRVPSGNVHNVKGYGLGLNYAKIIAEKHGGSISLWSEIGKGCDFCIVLPLNYNKPV